MVERSDGGEGAEAAKKRVLTLLAAMLFQTLKGHRWTPDAEQVISHSADETLCAIIEEVIDICLHL